MIARPVPNRERRKGSHFPFAGEHLFALVRERLSCTQRWANSRIARYADYFVITARWLGPCLTHEPGARLDILGFTLRYDRDRLGRPKHYLNVIPTQKSLAIHLVTLREMTRPAQFWKPVPMLVEEPIPSRSGRML